MAPSTGVFFSGYIRRQLIGQPVLPALLRMACGMVDIWRQSADQFGPTTDHRAPIATHPRVATFTKALTAEAAPIVTIATAATGGKGMKVAELKKGMLLKFKHPEAYSFLRDEGDFEWLTVVGDIKQTLRQHRGLLGQPLMIYLGSEDHDNPTHYGQFRKTRMVSINGRTVGIFPENWKRIEKV